MTSRYGLWALRLTPNGCFCCWELRKKIFFTTSYQAFVMLNIIICSREAWPHSSRNRPGSEEGTLMARSVGWSSTSPPFPVPPSHPPLSSRVILPTPPESSFPLLRGHPSHSSRIRIGGSTLVREASQAWPKMWQAHSSHCLCYLGCSSPALERYLLVAGAPGGGLRPWSSHRLDSGPPPTLFNCGTFNTLLTDLYPSVPHLWWRCYLSYCVARRIKWVNKFHLKF